MLDPLADERRALVDLFPQFLTRALRGWQELTPLLATAGIERPAFFLLRALVQERDAGDGMTREEMHAELFNPYSTIRPILDVLPALVERGYVANESGRYTVTESGRAMFMHIESAKNRYLAPLTPIPTADLTALTGKLMTIAQSLRNAPEPTHKAHQARAWRFMPPADAPPMVRLYGAVYALWMARDDSHNAAWRAAGFDGPTFDLLSRIWSGEAKSVPALIEATRGFQLPEEVERGVTALVATERLTRAGEIVGLTPRGREIRERIETQTDRTYFARWPSLASDVVAWLKTTLSAVITGVS